MLHVVDLNLMQATARHHPDGRPKDVHEVHRRDHILLRRQVRRQALFAVLNKIDGALSSWITPMRRQANRPQPTKC
jgi:hypothetical protein